MKKLVFGLLVTAMVFGFVGCSKKESAAAPSSGGGGSSKGPVEITFWHYFTSTLPQLTEYVERFNKENEGKIKVNAEFVPRAELIKQLTIGAVSGELPDVAQVDNPDHAAFSAMGIFADITDLYNAWPEKGYLQGPLNSCSLNGKIYGLPQSSNCLALWYDIDEFEKAGITKVPETWSELEAAAAKLTDPSRGQYGLALSAIGTEEGTFQFIPFLNSSGSFDKLDSPGSIAAAEFIHNLIKKGYVSREVVGWTQNDVEKQFAAGHAAMMIQGPWIISTCIADAPNKNFNIVKVPRADNGDFASCLGGENFAICKGDPSKLEASWTFIKWFCGTVSAEFNHVTGKFSPRSDVDNAALFSDNKYMALFGSVMPTAQPRGPHPRWPEVSNAVYTALAEIYTDQKDAAVALKEAQAKIEALSK